ncbi:MAG: hypothetical protein CMF63_03575, partial [Magnetovibrio sp.]|nr:hypothetical protein [Magnetovibrio sp.]
RLQFSGRRFLSRSDRYLFQGGLLDLDDGLYILLRRGFLYRHRLLEFNRLFFYGLPEGGRGQSDGGHSQGIFCLL